MIIMKQQRQLQTNNSFRFYAVISRKDLIFPPEISRIIILGPRKQNKNKSIYS